MSNLKLKYTNTFKDRHGHRRTYFRRRGYSATLPGEVGSAEFMAAYDDALKASAPKKHQAVDVRGVPAAGTFAALIPLYYDSQLFKKNRDTTKAVYRGVIDRFCEAHGHRKVAQMRYQHVAKIMGDMADKPGAANVLLKRISTLCSFAIRLGWIATNPCAEVDYYDGGEFHTWTEDEIAQYEACWPLGTRERLAFDTLLYTGQRVSDARLMPVPDREDKMRFVQQKTGTAMVLKAHQRLKESIAAVGVSHAVINPTMYGKPRTAKGLSNFVSDAIDAAGLPDRCVPHGLRKAAARRLADLGCSAHEIMALTGHTTLSQVEHYTKAAEQERLNARATARHEAEG